MHKITCVRVLVIYLHTWSSEQWGPSPQPDRWEYWENWWWLTAAWLSGPPAVSSPWMVLIATALPGGGLERLLPILPLLLEQVFVLQLPPAEPPPIPGPWADRPPEVWAPLWGKLPGSSPLYLSVSLRFLVPGRAARLGRRPMSTGGQAGRQALGPQWGRPGEQIWSGRRWRPASCFDPPADGAGLL